SVDSGAALKLVGWEPEIPDGKVDGELATSGNAFNPEGSFVYRASTKGQKAYFRGKPYPVENVLSRIRGIKGNFAMREKILSLMDLSLDTPLTRLFVNGTADIANSTLNLKARLTTDNASDLALPYYKALTGRGEFSGALTGRFDNPRISGKGVLANAAVEGYRFGSIASDFAYEKSLLNIRETALRAYGQDHVLRGTISFPEAKQLFDLAVPVFDLKGSVKNADFGKTVQIFYKDFPGRGSLSGDMRLTGKGEGIKIDGDASVQNGAVYETPFDGASFNFSYALKEFSVRKLRIVRNRSILNAEGAITGKNAFHYKASAQKIYLKDLGLKGMPDDMAVSLQSEGKGTFENPGVSIRAQMVSGTFKGREIGGGWVTASIRNKDIEAQGALFDEKMRFTGNARFDETMPWKARISILPSRYDFIVGSILKDVPEDLRLNLEGKVDLQGDRDNIAATVLFQKITLALFGQTFTNDVPIQISVDNRKLAVRSFALKSGTTSFRLQGRLEIGREFDLALDGSSSLAPLKTMSPKIGYLKGGADFVFSIRGKWQEPEIDGGMTVSNASFGLRDYPTYISSVNGNLHIDKDRIVLDRLAGKIGGGNVTISGIVYLKAFRVRRFYVDTSFDDITTTLSKDFTVNFSGDLLYKGTPEAQSLAGDVRINRARYKQMIEWRTWLISTKPKEAPTTELSMFERADLNIRISGSENISIDNNIARAPIRIRGDMIVKGTLANPILFGRIEATEGYVYFRNNEFRLIFASADFADPNRMKPLINLTAETTVKGYNIRLILEGQMDRFNLSLTSDPHLEEVDIFSLLTVGQFGKDIQGLKGGIGAGEATSFLTGKVQDVVEERLRSITGLDRFQVEPYVSKVSGTVGPRVTVSKRLVGDKLFLTYANPIGSTEEQVIKLEYLLSKTVSLVGFRDEKGSVGGDLKFRFEFK
ncbi:MAG: translocation/assembly module TamB domain-containing protein, partial [Nitrospirota bacterium]